MPMKRGFSKDVISSNIKEMVGSGHKPKQAIAAALSMARKAKKMSDGGLIDDDAGAGSDLATEANRGPEEMQILAQDRGDMVASPGYQDHEKELAKALFKDSEDAEMEGYAIGGLVQPEHGVPLGNKPDEDMRSMAEAPMSDEDGVPADAEHATINGVPEMPGLSEEARAAIREKRAKRMYMR